MAVVPASTDWLVGWTMTVNHALLLNPFGKPPEAVPELVQPGWPALA